MAAEIYAAMASHQLSSEKWLKIKTYHHCDELGRLKPNHPKLKDAKIKSNGPRQANSVFSSGERNVLQAVYDIYTNVIEEDSGGPGSDGKASTTASTTSDSNNEEVYNARVHIALNIHPKCLIGGARFGLHNRSLLRTFQIIFDTNFIFIYQLILCQFHLHLLPWLLLLLSKVPLVT